MKGENLTNTKGDFIMPTTQVRKPSETTVVKKPSENTKVKRPFEVTVKRDENGNITAISGKNFKSKP